MKAPNWTPEEDEILKKYYPVDRPIDILPRLPGRPFKGMKERARTLGLRSKYATTCKKAVTEPISMAPAWWGKDMKLAVCRKWV